MRTPSLLVGLALVVVVGCAPLATTLPATAPTPAPAQPLHTIRPDLPPSMTSATPTLTPPAAPPRTATINISGDLLWHNTLWYTAQQDAGTKGYDFAPQLSGLKPYVSKADLAICHNEVPVGPKGGPYKQYPMFASPPEVAAGIKATGWDLCTTASNHSMDAGWSGLVRTLDGLKAQGIMTVGTFRSQQEANTPVIFTTKTGVKVAVISQTYSLNGLSTPEGKPWAVQMLSVDKSLAQAKAAKKAGADIVVVQVHAGDEYSRSENKQQRDIATALTASPDVDLVYGQHAHVVQPVDKINGKWVCYGAGNLIAQSGPSQPWTYDGYLAQITFTEQPDGTFKASAAEYAPTMITKLSHEHPARVVVVADALKKPGANKAALNASAQRTRTIVNSLGAKGLTEYR